MNLLEIVESLSEIESELTIYAAKPWSASSDALAAEEEEDGSSPKAARSRGLDYFLEVFIAQEILEDWLQAVSPNATARQQCQRIIEYAENDA